MPAAGPAVRKGTVIRVLVAEDMQILRDTLVALLGLEEDIDVVAEISDGSSVVSAAMAQRPDVAVVDIDLPGTDGQAAAAQLHQQCPGCQVLILTVLGQPGNLRRALAAGMTTFGRALHLRAHEAAPE